MIAQVKIIVEVDPALAAGCHPMLSERLVRGLRASSCYRGVRVDGLPRESKIGPSIFTSSGEAKAALARYAAAATKVAERFGGQGTATGRWYLDHAAFYRLAGEALYQRRASLWPGEST